MNTVSAIEFGEQIRSIEEGSPILGPEGKELRRQLLSAIEHLRSRGLLTNPRSANASVRLTDTDDHVLVTARGMTADIGENDFGVVTLDGQFVSGSLGAGVRSVIAMHTHAYKRPGVGAVIHTHSINATAFAVAQVPIPVHYEPMVTRGQKVPVPVSPYGERNSGGLVGQLDGFLATQPDTRAVLLSNHGLLVFDETPQAAAQLAATIDEAASIFIRAQALGGSQPFNLS
ncbi:class II aldolase/adducin family protein [Aquamicrobium sp. LC103]|uniref:class II aldolase/adducin family protein n=1 Tax=Aquamicrobium sp. LC103 TaxID=1120658 RepID=UPI000A8DB79D|nr:class II aldolase/adducin family protein [Aquamicrobium sp. LC103]TKT69498.1 class II aldolase/adducin family protein [Aquamicrobium sp. LC103]